MAAYLVLTNLRETGCGACHQWGANPFLKNGACTVCKRTPEQIIEWHGALRLPINVVVFKWSTPGYRSQFTAEYVNIFAAMLARNTTVPYKLWCATDDPDGDVFAEEAVKTVRQALRESAYATALKSGRAADYKRRGCLPNARQPAMAVVGAVRVPRVTEARGQIAGAGGA